MHVLEKNGVSLTRQEGTSSAAKILLACSAGGHLTEMRQLESLYKVYAHFFVTFERPDTRSLAEKEKVLFIERPARNPIKTIKSFFQAWKIVASEKPRIVISTGADVTVPVSIAAKLQGIPVVFIESFCRYQRPSITGKIHLLFADYVLYQWAQLKPFYKRGIFSGPIFSVEGDKS